LAEDFEGEMLQVGLDPNGVSKLTSDEMFGIKNTSKINKNKKSAFYAKLVRK
jgi:hypothetical protein